MATIAVTSMASRLPARIREHNLTLVAAGVAFYAFLALVPMLVAFIAIYGLVADPNDVRRQVEDIGSSLPREVQDFLQEQLGEDGLRRSILVVATSDESPQMRRQAAYVTAGIVGPVA